MEVERDQIMEVFVLCDKKLALYEHPFRILTRGIWFRLAFVASIWHV